MGINYYYYLAIKEGAIAIDFRTTDPWFKQWVLGLVMPVHNLKNKDVLLKNRYFYFEDNIFKGTKTKTSKIKKLQIVDYLNLDNPNVKKPIINFI